MPDKTAAYQQRWIEESLEYNISADLTTLFQQARLPVCSDSCSALDDSPILLFSPGYSFPRLIYNVLASAIASKGYTVITIDHPGDANIIIYPDGHAAYNNDTAQTLPVISEHSPIRSVDASFVIDQLSNATAMGELLPKRGPKPLPTDRVAMFGHSLGGVAAVVAAGKDSRIRAAINWDGTFIETPSNVSQPVLLMSHSKDDDTWLSTFPLLNGPKLWVNIDNTTHYSFSDIATLLAAAGQDATALADLLGTIAPSEMVRILVEYTTAWMDGVFAAKEGEPVLRWRQPRGFPEVSTVERSNA
ncbi:hypothetical protein LTR37_008979 [Vermiconidia calcicola]|uniref:Uncharacterized protein n=1 Tax=Vermiconidia calcicola TaxID=1690605 RepID=A0ACC3NAQ8_9PEZI|nr:hypothetical protein LTR37_008979 [Vermiconidia calcicola]